METSTILTIWALVGPLIVGAASALFSRRMQVNDRDHADRREELRFDRDSETRRREHDVAQRLKTYEEAKAALADFMTMTHVFVRRQTEYVDHIADAGLGKAALEANEALLRSHQLVTLLSDDPLENAALVLFNCTISLPRPAANRNHAWRLDLDEYKDARAAFNMQAKRFLTALRAD